MTIRKHKNPSPGFGIPPPYNQRTGTYEPLIIKGDYPYCAMMQIAADDEFADYVICRGYDPRVKKFFDYVEDDADKIGIPVAKPWSNRTAGAYTVGHIFPAVLPLTKLGQSPGVAATSDGQPADLDEEVGILYTDDSSRVVSWILLDADDTAKFAKLDEDLDQGDEAEATIWSGDPLAETSTTVTVYDWFLESSMKLASGVKVMLTPMSGKLYVTQSDTCPVDQ